MFGAVFSLRNMVRKLGGEDDKYGPHKPTLCDRRQEGRERKKRYRVKVAVGDDEELTWFEWKSFVCYRTCQYKLHYYETPTNLKFVMMTDTKANNMRLALHQIYVNLYVEYGESLHAAILVPDRACPFSDMSAFSGEESSFSSRTSWWCWSVQ